jgi:hypothetical protein
MRVQPRLSASMPTLMTVQLTTARAKTLAFEEHGRVVPESSSQLPLPSDARTPVTEPIANPTIKPLRSESPRL